MQGSKIGQVRLHSIVIAVYALAAVAMTWPLTARLQGSVAGEGGDVWQTMWRFESKYSALAMASADNHVSDFIKQEFLGGGEMRLVNLSVWPWMWAYLLFGMPVGYNVLWLLFFVLAGYGMFLFVRYVGHSHIYVKGSLLGQAPAFLTGLFYMFLPFRIAHAQGHFGAMQTHWLPFILLTGLGLYRRFSWWKVVALWLLLTLQAWSEHHYALWLVLLAGVLAGMNWREMRLWFAKRQVWLAALAVAGLLSMSVLLPYAPTMRLSAAGNSLDLGETQASRFSADLFAFVVPAPTHPWWGNMFNQLFARYFSGNPVEATQFLGWLPLLLILFFREHIPILQRRLWLVVGATFFVISLGPFLHVFGSVMPWPMPYALIDSWPVFSAVRTVARAGVMVGFSAAILLFWVLKKNVHRAGSAALFGALVLLEFLFAPVYLQSAQLSQVYSYLQPGSGSTIIEIPAATNYTAASRALYAALRSGKEALGNIALERAQAPEDVELIKSVPAVRQLLYLRTTELRRDRSEFFDQSLAEVLPDALKFLDVGEIIVHTDSLTPLQLSAIRGFLEDDVHLEVQAIGDVLFYRVPAVFSIPHDRVFLTRDSRWQGVRRDAKKGHVYGEVMDRAAVTLVNVSASVQPMRIKLFLASDSPASLRIWRSGQEIGEIKPGGVGVYPIGALPGKTVIDFERIGSGRAIIQDPQLLYGQ